MYSVMWSEHCSYKSSRAYLSRFPTEAPWVLVGPGRGRGRRRHRRRARGRGAHREPQPPVGGRAVPGRGDRRRRHHPRHLLDGRAADRADGPAALRLARRRAHPLPLRGRRVGHQRLRQLGRRADGRRRGRVRRHLPRQPAGERVLPRHPADGTARARAGRGPRQPRGAARHRRPAATASAARACSRRRRSRTATRRSARRCRSATRSRRSGSSRRASSCSTRELAVGVQDLGAAGLVVRGVGDRGEGRRRAWTSTSRASRKREPGMNPVEVMTSESQERMLAIVEPAKLDAVLDARAALGDPRDGRRARHRHRALPRLRRAVRRDRRARREPDARRSATRPSDVTSDAPPIADVPVGSLGDGPLYHRPVARPAAQDALQADDPGPQLRDKFPPGADSRGELLALLATPTIADKTWVSRQYDHQLFLNTVAGPGADAAVLRVKGTSKALALSTDGKARFCQLDPRTGGRLVVLEAARNVACIGARPLALVNCLNFGNPEHPEVMWQFSEVVEGMSEACEALGIPVIGGNVSFYNASGDDDIHPTPVVGVLGSDRRARATAPPRPRLRPGDDDRRARRRSRPELGGSEWAAVVHGLDGGMPPAADLDRARAAARRSSPTLVRDARGRRRARRERRRARGRARARWRSRATWVPRRLLDRAGARSCTAAEACFAESTSRWSSVVPSRWRRCSARRGRGCPRPRSVRPAATSASPTAPARRSPPRRRLRIAVADALRTIARSPTTPDIEPGATPTPDERSSWADLTAHGFRRGHVGGASGQVVGLEPGDDLGRRLLGRAAGGLDARARGAAAARRDRTRR